MNDFSDALPENNPVTGGLEQMQARLNHEDPREALRLRLEVRQRVIETIEKRLSLKPDDKHQRFILEEHLKARDAMVAELREHNLRLADRYQGLDAFVNEYVQQISQPAISDGPERERLKALEHELQTWEDLIAKVRARLVKRPGDPLLMKLLAEHQARLLKLQESRRVMLPQPEFEANDLPESVLESIYSRVPEVPQIAADASATGDKAPENTDAVAIDAPVFAPSAEVLVLQRELEVFKGMLEKTRVRLAAKPELVHLKQLIVQHEARIRDISEQLDKLS